MKKFIGFLGAMFLLTNFILAQNKGDVNYKGGFSAFERDISKNLWKYVQRIPFDYVLFYEITFNKKGVIAIKELYANSDSFTANVSKAVEETAGNWITKSRISRRVIIPIFLIENADEGRKSPTSTIADRKYQKDKLFKKCILTPPILFVYFGPIHKHVN